MKKLEKLTNIIEALLFVNGKAVAIEDIAVNLGVSKKDISDAAKELQKKYSSPCGLNLLIFNDKLQFASNPEYAEQVSLVLSPIRERELSRSMLETAAIIAYKQPVTRLDLEEIRGNSEYALQNLLKLGVIEIVGRKNAIGRPVLFGTTDEFLKRFQISSLKDLPDYDELMTRIRSLNGTDQTDNYLFKKEEYVEGAVPPSLFPEDLAKVTKREKGAEADISADFDLIDVADEDIPDFLEGEDVQVLTGDEDK